MELIRHEARVDNEHHEIPLGSPTAFDVASEQPGYDRFEHERLGSSSPEPSEAPQRLSTTTRDGIKIPGIRRPSAQELEYSGDELAHFSDFSDTPPHSYTPAPEFGSFINRSQKAASTHSVPYAMQQPTVTARNSSQVSGFHVEQDERVIWHGYLLYLKTKGGVRQWKRLWVVLRPKNLAFYKNEEVCFRPSNLRLIPAGFLNTLRTGIRSEPHTSAHKHHQRR